MWLRVLIVISVTTRTWSQYTYANQKVQQGGTQFEWGWQLTPVETQLPIDNLFVQSGPQIQYADNIALQNAGTLVDATGFNYNVIPYEIYQNPENLTQTVQEASPVPLDIFYHQQFPVPQTQPNNIADSIQYTNLPQNTYTLTEQNNPTKDGKSATASLGENNNANNAIITPIVQVFKDHNCTNDDIKEQSNTLDENITNEDDNFGAKERNLYQEAADFKIETRSNNNNEGYYYYSTEITPTTRNYFEDQEGISKLVASTQDLISNDDLITINHSAEKQVYDIDESIKPYLKTEESRNKRKNHITLKAKISNIENTAITNSNKNNQMLQNNYENKFSSPIVVQDSNYDDYQEQILDTLVSTMTPFVQNGYVITSITKNRNKNAYIPNFNEETVYVTPRPIGQKYLAPITVALRLLNSNNSDIFNTIEDHDTSDSEFIEEKVKLPSKERTIVEIQESIPLDITHINEVEVHQYLEAGSNDKLTQNEAREQRTYNYAFSRNNVENNQFSNEFGKKNVATFDSHSNFGNEVKNGDYIEKIEPNENMESQVTVEFDSFKENQQNNTNNENDVFGKRNNRKVIQPIIVEKEVPQYVDRYIEKQTADRPVVIPVPYEKIVEKPVEVTKYIDKPYPVAQPYPVPIKVPYPVEKKVYVDRPVHVPYPVEKVVEKEVVRNVPVPTPVAVPVKVQIPVEKPVIVPIPVDRPYPVPVEKPVEKIVEKEIPVPYPVEKKVLYPVPYEKMVHVPYPVEKQVPVEKIVEKPVRVNVPVPIPVHIIKHFPVDRIVEKKVPIIYPVDRIVEKKVPYPVEKVVEKPTIVTKYIDRPYVMGNSYNPKETENKTPYIFQTYTLDNYKQETQNIPKYYQNEQNNAEKSQTINQRGYLKDNEMQFTYTVPIQTTQWGSLYASTYKYVDIKPDQIKNKIYNKYQNIYYGPPPLQTYNNYWENGYNSVKTNRFERQPKVTNLRIEYGFKPPLIPSIEVDIDGRPINKVNDK